MSGTDNTTHTKNIDTVISCKKVHKYFFLHHQKTFKELFQAYLRGYKRRDRIHALQGISFDVKRGESIGIVGKNGAGKSTLLELLAGVSEPTKGTVDVQGVVAPLISLGAGFHPELTGRENIYLNGVILGMREREIDKVFDDIVAFSELDDDFIESPVKYYSSGMYMRLAFSVAIHTNPDILLIDEILAVGDEGFRNKCFERLEKFKKDNVTLIYVSHDLNKVADFCERVIYIRAGKVAHDGNVKEGLKKFRDDLHIHPIKQS